MRRVLVFDDDPQICELLEAALSEAGCVVWRARSREDAMQIVDRERISLALVDTPMVNFTGIQLAVYASARSVKVLMMVAGKDATLRVEALGLPYILKPFRVADVIDRVNAMLPGADATGAKTPYAVEQDPDPSD